MEVVVLMVAKLGWPTFWRCVVSFSPFHPDINLRVVIFIHLLLRPFLHLHFARRQWKLEQKDENRKSITDN
jgi:hypothetical protein